MIVDPVRIGPAGFPPENRTLGWAILGWQVEYLKQPDGPNAGEPWKLTTEQLRFLLWWYALDESGRFVYRRGVFRRMKGHGKDPLAASLALSEFCGPCRFDGWDADGLPVAAPHPAPWVQVAATNQDQTRNTMTLLPGMLSDEAIDEYGVDLGKTIVYSRGGGRIEAVTSSPRAIEGGRPTYVVANETHHWIDSNEGKAMWKAIARNLAKSRDGSARALAITNAHEPGEGSVAEDDWDAYQAIESGRSRATGFLYDSLQAPDDVDLSDREQLREALMVARGDSTWLDVDRLLEEINDPTTSPSVARRFYLNQITAAEDAWIAPWQWAGCADATKTIGDGETVTLGFDGSVREDATALVACRVEDGHLELLGCWERPNGPAGRDWQVDRVAVDQAVATAMDRYRVVGFYADPPHWQDYLDRWSQQYGPRMLLKASATRPLEWWTNRVRSMVTALERFYEAVVSRDLTHDGDSTLTRHVLNAKRRLGPSGVTISKEHPQSPRKIDAVMAAVLAYECRADAVARRLDRSSRRTARSGRGARGF